MSDELKTPNEWQKVTGIKIMDPDGWRGHRFKPWDDPISEDEFRQRAAISTVWSDRGAWERP